MKKIVILISGRGSNMQAIVEAQIPGAEVVAVIANKPEAAGIAWAEAQGIATLVVTHKNYDSREAFDQALASFIDGYEADLVVLAGFMRILTAEFVNHFAGRLINIHPSLLPAFTGLHTHERALSEGVKVHGCTVHFVTADLDHGPIIIQAVVPVLENDTVETLSARTLQQEHRIYPQAVCWLLDGRAQLREGRVFINQAQFSEGATFPLVEA